MTILLLALTLTYSTWNIFIHSHIFCRGKKNWVTHTKNLVAWWKDNTSKTLNSHDPMPELGFKTWTVAVKGQCSHHSAKNATRMPTVRLLHCIWNQPIFQIYRSAWHWAKQISFCLSLQIAMLLMRLSLQLLEFVLELATLMLKEGWLWLILCTTLKKRYSPCLNNSVDSAPAIERHAVPAATPPWPFLNSQFYDISPKPFLHRMQHRTVVALHAHSWNIYTKLIIATDAGLV